MAKKAVRKKEFRLPSDLAEVQKASAKVLAFLRPLSLSEAASFDIRLCLEEALINAMKYGHGLRPELEVRLAAEYDDESIRLTIEDHGPGFDVDKVADCTQKSNLLRGSGRGVYLIRQLMDEVEYNAKGNRLTMTKRLVGPETKRLRKRE